MPTIVSGSAPSSKHQQGLLDALAPGRTVAYMSDDGFVQKIRTQALSTVESIDGASDAALDSLRKPSLIAWVERFAHAGDGGAVWLLLLIVFGRRSPRAVLRAGLVLSIASVLVNGPVKKLSSRPRPAPLDNGGFRPHGSSFPSGHSFSSWMMVWLLPPVRGLRFLAVPVASLITMSRVYLRYHHTSDVLAGSLLGSVVGWTLRRFVRWR